MHPRRWLYARTRRRLGARFLSGDGIEIGALHRPFPAGPRARVRYLDRFTTEQLREEYPELAGEPFADVEIVDDGETLATVPDGSQDFVIASHVLEHTQDPIGTLRRHLAVLRPGGVVMLALPDRRTGIDELRAPTTLEHVLADHADGGSGSRAEHYREWAELVDLPLGYVERADLEAHAAQLDRSQYSIHFHCWTLDELLAQLPAYGLPATVAAARQNLHEFLVVLRRD
ncbi:MAG: Methyltransferase type 11 [Solirubrobacterales bacterium]|nr:Methyltransferase type 11 [Solirubrobacterales bacterium]